MAKVKETETAKVKETETAKVKGAQTENVDALDTYKQNALRTVDEMAKYQPQYAESISNLQQEYLQITRETITMTFAVQKSWYASVRNPYMPATLPYAEQFKKQSDEATSQAFQVFGTANKLVLDSFNVTRENIKLYTKTCEAMYEYNANLAKTWSDYFTSTQRQYSK
jgi:hypothetical protein